MDKEAKAIVYLPFFFKFYIALWSYKFTFIFIIYNCVNLVENAIQNIYQLKQ